MKYDPPPAPDTAQPRGRASIGDRLRRMARQIAERRRRGRRPAGIGNRPVEEELAEQEHLPPRGTARGESDPVLPPRPGAHAPPRDPAPKRMVPKDPPAG
jgi:hypothetical protein